MTGSPAAAAMTLCGISLGADSDAVNYSNSCYGGVSLDHGRGVGWGGVAEGDTYRSVSNRTSHSLLNSNDGSISNAR